MNSGKAFMLEHVTARQRSLGFARRSSLYITNWLSLSNSAEESSPLQFQRSRSMRHLMPIVTPRLILRPPMLGDLDSIQTAKEEAWPDLQRWMTWAFDNQRSRQAMEDSIRRTMDYQNQAGIALAGFHRIKGDFVVRTALDLTDEQDVYETGYWVAPKYAGQSMATEAANAAIRYAFGHLGAKAITIGYFDRNEPSRRIV